MKKDIETIYKNQKEMKNTISEMKNTLEGIKSRLNEAENEISDLEEKKTTQSGQQKRKKKDLQRMRMV